MKCLFAKVILNSQMLESNNQRTVGTTVPLSTPLQCCVEKDYIEKNKH